MSKQPTVHLRNLGGMVLNGQIVRAILLVALAVVSCIVMALIVLEQLVGSLIHLLRGIMSNGVLLSGLLVDDVQSFAFAETRCDATTPMHTAANTMVMVPAKRRTVLLLAPPAPNSRCEADLGTTGDISSTL
eukprot:CAMPEP_0179045568 /NCGR_PEP_ID=MMETSP0796-20121207/18243_1 /TAXON_ID=73915 /ORGANISM="Pyrodinium bahamense, Strain pbaha01" /LENGTH=131 /DNA_ID=CAMNT_0020741975 /DNA_START=404 /DNA_END=801 /DNA_ORIENTATION=-